MYENMYTVGCTFLSITEYILFLITKNYMIYFCNNSVNEFILTNNVVIQD